MTEEELLAFKAKMRYALGTQFGEVPHRGRTAAATNVMVMFVNDLLKERERANLSK